MCSTRFKVSEAPTWSFEIGSASVIESGKVMKKQADAYKKVIPTLLPMESEDAALRDSGVISVSSVASAVATYRKRLRQLRRRLYSK